MNMPQFIHTVLVFPVFPNAIGITHQNVGFHLKHRQIRVLNRSCHDM